MQPLSNPSFVHPLIQPWHFVKLLQGLFFVPIKVAWCKNRRIINCTLKIEMLKMT
jgi:hypothetical protein